tara:strand:- start:315 stop:479 length:165 start_codon:yes stop_codon:yes gene_type:complete
MAGIARIGIDTAGGIIISNVASCNVFINGLGVVRQGDVASCGHVATGSGSISAA